MSGRFDGRTAVVTGASAGIGRQLARLLHTEGARVLVTGRDRDRTTAAAREVGSPVFLVDNLDLRSVVDLGRRIRQEVDHVDVLFSNAGAAVTDRRPTVDGHEPNHQVNTLAPLLLEHVLAPALAAAPDPRIVSTSSDLHRRARLVPGRVAADLDDRSVSTQQRYARAKLTTLVAHTVAQAERGAVPVTDVHPGVVASDFGRYLGRVGRVVSGVAAPFLISPATAAHVLAGFATEVASSPGYHHRGNPRAPSALVTDASIRAEVAADVERRLCRWATSD